MPYRWTEQTGAPPQWRLTLWPHRSLSPNGFVGFIAITAALLLLPLLAVLGSPVLWGLLPFVIGAVWLIWHFLSRSYADAELREDLSLTATQISLIRHNPRSDRQTWQANPYWLRFDIHDVGGPVENYLTLTGGGRTVELGAFLSSEERIALFRELSDRLHALDVNAAFPPENNPGTGNGH